MKKILLLSALLLLGCSRSTCHSAGCRTNTGSWILRSDTPVASEQCRFHTLFAEVHGNQTVIGAWDTMRGEALLFPENADFFKKHE